MLYFVALLATATLPPGEGDTPALFRMREAAISPRMLAEAVNHFVAVGEQATIRELEALAAPPKSQDAAEVHREIRTRERIGWVCRILYQPKGGKPLRPPMYGAHHLPVKSMPLKDWPLYPVAASGSTYFILSEGYFLAGYPEHPLDYLDYCRREGRFRKDPIPLPTREQAMKDAARLRQSGAWKAIKWLDQGKGARNELVEDDTWQFIERQAEAIKE